MKNQIKSVMNINDYDSHIKWRLTEACNHKCSYCIRVNTADPDGRAEDERICLEAAPEVNRVIEELRGSVLMELIGGEVSLFDLEGLLEKITSHKLRKITLTSNFSAPLEYYESLVSYCARRGMNIGLTFSWHSEYMDFDSFTAKFSAVSRHCENLSVDCDVYLKAEVVSRVDNQEDVARFKDFCEAGGFNYLIDADLRPGIEKGSLLSCASQSKPRYRVTYHGGKEDIYNGRNCFLTSDSPGIIEKRAFITYGYKCNRDLSFVYIFRDMHQGIKEGGKSFCREYSPLSEFHVRSEPVVCPRRACTLCGRIDVWRD